MAKRPIKRKGRKVKRLPWEYCECGCKGHDVRVGSRNFWMFNDLKGGFYLFEGHGMRGEKLGRYASFDDADEAARKQAKPEFRRIQKEAEELRYSFR